MPATLHDVAKLAGVSIKTVSNVVNDYPSVRPETRQRVQDAIAELDYRPNLSARNLRSGRSGVIGLVLPELSLSYFAQLADAVIARADHHGLVVQIEQTGGDRLRELAVLTSSRTRMADGLIFSPLGMEQGDADRLRVSYPLVLLGERIFGGPVDHVTMRNVEAARAATRVLVESGRRRVALVGAHPGEVMGSAALRLMGYRAALDEAGLTFDPALIESAGLWHQAEGAEAVKRLLASGVEFDGVFAMNDALALGVLRVLHQERMRIPEEVAVIGFDNIDEGQYAMPSLTTVDPGRAEIARQAVDLLVERIARRAPIDEPREVLVDFEVLRRESA
ncbi:MAG: LacI family transcriptional regulator [Microbacterium sp. SCN 70-200]|uniref:LacI family DNA-binding transcriptional regulator n=1 Tax=unclassified Microbacterium TaxID=2609290 RepID=UPI00086A7DFF|nr:MULTISPECIES: LacI family DNA-binding transcriptional regulator [unclassified Microbacterium]MBN9215325.1 LacI family DNA-binding transcriptional regulator [Microbacterium sp.]ODT42796.1 MAG: LacI family transcriptional regulator [Microbacterium sp. SCN 70-200]OJV80116.1 MAG: LacI family transcriptional regulator [Microbacterium sp. 70-16]